MQTNPRKKALDSVKGSIGALLAEKLRQKRQPPAPPPEEKKAEEPEFSEDDLRALMEHYQSEG